MPVGHEISWNELAPVEWGDVKTGVPDGYYKVIVRNVEEHHQDGDRGARHWLSVHFNVLAPTEYEGSTIFYNFNLPTTDTEQGKLRFYKQFLVDFMEVIEMPPDEDGNFDPDAWHGQVLYVQVKNQEYEGQNQIRIRRFLKKLPRSVTLDGDEEE
jgi:hypothetical protein